MYGPKTSEKVCKVNFSRLSDQEKRNTSYLLAKQDHEIVFEEEGDYFVANVKFVKSPQKAVGDPGSVARLTSKSPEAKLKTTKGSKSPDLRKVGAKPSTTAVPTSAKKTVQPKTSRLVPDRSKSRQQIGDRTHSPNLTKFQPADKLELIKEYQPLFPKNDLSDTNYRPIMIGKSKQK